MRLTESGWIDKVNELVKEAITKRLENGQATNKIKFEQLYTDVIKQARGKNLPSYVFMSIRLSKNKYFLL